MSTTATVERALAPLLGRIATHRETGLLTATQRNHKRLFCVQEGAVILAVSNVIEEQVERRLCRDGLLDKSALEPVRRQATERGLDVAAFLAEQEQPGPAQVRSAVLRHVRGLLDSTLDWKSGEYSFARGRPNVGQALTIELSLPSVLLAHAQTLDWPIKRLRPKIGPPNSTPFIDAAKASFLSDVDREGVVGFLLERCAGSDTVDQLCEASPGDVDETIRALYALALMGLVEQHHHRDESLKPDSTVTRAECEALLGKPYPDHYAVLGLERGASAEDVRAAYYYLARRYHPDRFRSGPLEDLLERFESYFTRVTEAYNTLIDEVLRAEYDAQLADRLRKDVRPKEDSTYLAKTNYARARVLIDKRRFQDSVQFLENAVKLDDSQSEYHMELGRVLVRSPRRRKEAEHHLERAVQLDPANVAAYLALGELYRKTDREEKAVETYREALRWEPDNISAQQELKDLGVKEQGDDGGLLRGLFRK